MMPERIWADMGDIECSTLAAQHDVDTEYVRADIHEAECNRLRKQLRYAVEWARDRGCDDPETAPEWFLSALKEDEG